MKFKFSVLAACMVVAGMLLLQSTSWADPTNEPPPAGTVIYSLTGQTISSTYQTGIADFVAGVSNTNISFAFREDPAHLELGDVSLIDTTTGSSNLLLNGDFGLGPVGSPAPTDWAYLNNFGAAAGGVVDPGCGPGVTGTNPNDNCYFDGAVQAYDAINQVVATTVGDSYELSFQYAYNCPGSCGEAGDVTVYQPLSTNGDVSDTGGNGRDMFVYAGAGVPTPSTVPEPSSLALFGIGLFGLACVARRRKLLA